MSEVADKLAKKMPRRPGPAKQVRLKLVYLNLRSSVLVSLLIGMVLGVLTILITLVAWVLVTRTGALDQFDTLVSGATGVEGGVSVKGFFTFNRVIAFSVALGLINLVVVTIFGTVLSLVYNLIVKLTGGLFIGFTNT